MPAGNEGGSLVGEYDDAFGHGCEAQFCRVDRLTFATVESESKIFTVNECNYFMEVAFSQEPHAAAALSQDVAVGFRRAPRWGFRDGDGERPGTPGPFRLLSVAWVACGRVSPGSPAGIPFFR
jgi:hypothetical protein